MIYNANLSVKPESVQADGVEEKEPLQFPNSDKIKNEVVKKEVEGRIVGNNQVEEEVINQQPILPKTNRKGKRNWAPAYIVRVVDWCIDQKAGLGIGKRAISRLAAEF